jgi:hypothetical protein
MAAVHDREFRTRIPMILHPRFASHPYMAWWAGGYGPRRSTGRDKGWAVAAASCNTLCGPPGKQFFFNVLSTCYPHRPVCIEICALGERVQNTLRKNAEHESRSTFERWEIARAEHICVAIHIRVLYRSSTNRAVATRYRVGTPWNAAPSKFSVPD